MSIRIITIVLMLAMTLLVGWPPPLSATAPAPTPPGVTEPLQPVVPVTFREPVQFWRAGKQEQVTSALVLRVKVTDVFAFIPRDSAPPLFLFGNSVCRVLRESLRDGVAVLVAPWPRPGESEVVRIVSFSDAKRLDEQFLRALPPQRGTPINLPASTVKPKIYENFEQLARQFALPASQGHSP